MPRRRPLPLVPALALAALAITACDGGLDAGPAPGEVGLPIINGTDSPTITPLTSGELLAIGFLANASGDPFCSGTVIRRYAVLTAQHCVKDKVASDLRFGIGAPGSPRALVRVSRIALADWETDLALLQLANDASTVGGLAPIPENRAALGQELVGEDVEIAGYAPVSNVSTRRFAVLEVTSVFDALTLDGFGRTGACHGDSGGPVLLVGGNGRAVVGGTAIGGDESCRNEVYYSRVDRALAWLDAQLAVFASDGETSSDPPAASPTFDPWGCGQSSCSAGAAGNGLALLVALAFVARRAGRRATTIT